MHDIYPDPFKMEEYGQKLGNGRQDWKERKINKGKGGKKEGNEKKKKKEGEDNIRKWKETSKIP